MRIYLLILLPFLAFNALSAQSDLKIGQWTTHLPFNSGKAVTLSDHYCYYATENAILKIDLSDFSQSKITRTEGLNGTTINTIYFHKPSNSLLIAYSDGLIDLINENGIFAITDILHFNNIPINKNINTISYAGSESVFINSDFGINELNLKNRQFIFTIFTNEKIKKTIRFNNYLYTITEKGLYSFQENNGNIVEDFAAWKLVGENEGILKGDEFTGICVYKSNLYCTGNNTIYKSSGQNQFTTFFDAANDHLSYVSGDGPDLLVGNHCTNSCNKILVFDEGGLLSQIDNDCTSNHEYSIQQVDGRIWTIDPRWGFHTMLNPQAACEVKFSTGPISSSLFEILPTKSGVYIAAGGYDGTYTYLYNSIGIMTYINKKWANIDYNNNQVFKENDMRDILHIVEHPDGNKLFFSSFQRGLVEYNKTDNSYKLYNEKNTNKILDVAVGDESRVRLSGIAYDKKKKTLWMTDFLAKKPIVSYADDGTWRAYESPGFGTQLINVTVDANGYKWIIARENFGVLVFDEGDPNVLGDERNIILNQSNSNLTTNKINTVEVDLEGDVWVGTPSGPIVFECGTDIFSGNCKGSRRKVDQNGIIGYLLETEDIQSIAVDGGNRKWFGTRNGIYVQSSSGEEQIHLFTKSNSPLMDNTIVDIGIDQITGDVWIGSAKGIQVYRSEATAAKNVFTGDATAFPNPVQPGYAGIVAIKNLARDAKIKITDISGKLVFETSASGGTAIWDTKDYLGNSVVSGTYLVFANSTKDFDKSEGLVTKIFVVR